MKLDIKSDKSIYIGIDDHIYYIDNSTDEQIIVKYKNKTFPFNDGKVYKQKIWDNENGYMCFHCGGGFSKEEMNFDTEYDANLCNSDYTRINKGQKELLREMEEKE